MMALFLLKIPPVPSSSSHPAFSYASFGSSTANLFPCSFKTPLRLKPSPRRSLSLPPMSAALHPLDLTEENVRQVLGDARTEFAQIFDASVGITGPNLDQVIDSDVNLQQYNALEELIKFSNQCLKAERLSGEAELAEIDGPVVTLTLRGRFWHKRSTVLSRLSNYLKNRIPEILDVDIEDERQLDDSPENF